jgi:predicted phosphodiesterase
VTDAQKAHLEAVRAASVALAMSIDELLAVEEQPPDPSAPCLHPEELRIDMAAMGHAHRFQCRVCKEIVNP